MGSPREAAQAATDSAPGRWLIRFGLVAYGVVHLLVAWIAVQVAWGGSSSGDQASQQGALQQMGQAPLGRVLLWATAVGLGAMALWQLIAAIAGYRDYEASTRWRRRVGSAGKAVLYGWLCWSAGRQAVGSGISSGGQAERSLTARILGSPVGRVGVIVVGLVIVGIGVWQIVRGIARKFTEDLAGTPSPVLLRLGQIGFAAKGIALVVIGGLFCWAALSYDPDKAGGLDDALRTVASVPAGSLLLTLLAAGIACFGLYCFVWAGHART